MAITQDDIDADRRERRWAPTRAYPTAIAALGVVGVLVVGVLTGVEVSILTSIDLLTLPVALVVASLLFWGGAVLYRRRDDGGIDSTGIRIRIRMKRFLASNSLVSGGGKPPVRGLLSELGSRRHVVENIRSTPATVLPFEVAVLDCIENPGSNVARLTTFTYLVVPLERALPHMLLDSRANDRITSSLPVPVGRRQLLSLEGDFDRHFRLYCPAEYERDALYLFTPDLMGALVDHARDFDVEVVGSRAYFFTNRALDLTSPEVWDDIDALLTSVAPKLSRVARRYSDERAPTRPEGAPRIAPPGRALKRRFRIPLQAYWTAAVIAIFALAILTTKLR